MIASMRSALWTSFAALLLAVASPIAEAQINPAQGIRWPPCTGLQSVYSIPTNTCIVPGSGGGGGSSPNPPDYSIQYALGSLFSSDPTITIDPVLHVLHVGTPNANPIFKMSPLGTILSNWTFDITSPTTAIDSLTGPGVEAYVWTYHLGIGQWQPPPTGGVTSVTPGTSNLTCTPFVGGKCVGDITINVTAATTFDAIGSGTSTGKTFTVGNGTVLVPSGTGEIQATHTTATGLLQCLESQSSGAIQGAGAACNLWATLAGGTSTAAFHVGSGGSLDHAGGGSIDATEINGIPITGTPVAGDVATASGPTAASWQPPAAGVTHSIKITAGICTTGGTGYSSCTMGPFTWPNGGFPDTNYAVTCMGYNPSGSPNNFAVTGIFGTTTTATQFNLIMFNGDASGASTVTLSRIDCIGSEVH